MKMRRTEEEKSKLRQQALWTNNLGLESLYFVILEPQGKLIKPQDSSVDNLSLR